MKSLKRLNNPRITRRHIGIAHAVLSLLFVLAGIYSYRSIRIMVRTERHLAVANDVRDASAVLTRDAFRILMVSYTPMDEHIFARSVDRYSQSLRNAESILGEYDNLELLTNHGNYLLPELDGVIQGLYSLRDSDLSGGNMALVERTILYEQYGLEINDGIENYIVLGELTSNLDFFFQETSTVLEDVLIALNGEIIGNREKGLQLISLTLVFYLSAIGVSIILAALNRISRALIAEEAAKVRSDALEELVKARTEDLEIQNRQLKEASDLLVEREKMTALGQVVSGVAHEVNTPLGICVTAATYLSDIIDESGGWPDPEESREVIRLILENITRASNLIKGFKRVAVDEMDDEARAYDISAYLAEDLLPGLRSMLRPTRQVLEFARPGEIPVYGFPGSVAQVITNLVSNASVHGYGLSAGGTIRLALEEEGNQLILTVSDSGKGMSPETRERIFEPFFTTNRENGGSGLGMMVVYNIVRLKLNGSVECISQPESGTRFTVRLPKDSRLGPGDDSQDSTVPVSSI